MHTGMRMVPGVLLCCALALAGNAVATWAAVPVPGAVLGMTGYAAWLWLGRGIGWSVDGAQLLVRWIGAMIVPALVGLQALLWTVSGALVPLLVLLVVTTMVTALATAALYRWVSGRG